MNLLFHMGRCLLELEVGMFWNNVWVSGKYFHDPCEKLLHYVGLAFFKEIQSFPHFYVVWAQV